jgi:hypothetical protein
MLTAKGNLETELRSARDRVKDLSKEIRTIQASGGTVGDELAGEFRQASLAADKLGRQVNDTNQKIKRMTTEAGSASKQMGGLGKALKATAGIAAAYVSVTAVSDFMKDAIVQGSSLQESMSKTSVVFGSNARQVMAWSETSSTAFGLSQQAALEAVGTYGNLFQAFGLGRAESADMSKALVGLAADLASFNNTSVDDAVQALRAGVSGETEGLKRYGIAITEARVKAEAMRRGLVNSAGVLDTAGKAQATYALIMADSALAQGDYARTADGFANSMKTLTAEFDTQKGVIGTEMITAIEKAVEAFGGSEGLTSALQSAGDATADFVAGIGGAVESLGTLVEAIDSVVAVGDNGLVDFLLQVDKVINPVQRLIGSTMDYGDELRAQEKKMKDSTSAAEDLYAGYIATWDASSKAAAGIEDVGDEADDAAGKVSALARAMNRFTGAADRQQALRDWKRNVKDAIAKPSADAAYDAVEAFDRAFGSFKDGSKRQAAFVAQNYADMKGIVAKSGLSETQQEQLLAPLNAARDAARTLLDELRALDGTTVSIGVNGVMTMPQYRPMAPVQRAAGGIVMGPGTATSDSIPALLSNGEYVVRASAVKALGVGTLDKLNRVRDVEALPSLVGASAAVAAPLVGQVHVEVHNPAQGVDVEKAVMRGLARVDRIKRERG